MSWPPVFKTELPIQGASRPRRWLMTVLKTVVSLGLLTYLFSKIDVRSVMEALRNIQSGFFILALILFLCLQLVGIFRWRFMVLVQGYEHSFSELARFYFAGLFFNLFLPTSIGGDLGKCYYLAGSRSDVLRAMTTILADRISGMLALVCIASAALLANRSVVIPAWMTAFTVGGTVLLILGLLIPFVSPRFFRRYELPYRYWQHPQFMAASLAASFFIQLSVVFINMFIGRAVGVDIPWGFYFIFTPLVTVAGMIPISLNGLGVREGAYVYFLAQAGVAAPQAMAFAILWLIQVTTVSLLGGIGWILTSRSVSAAKT